MNPFDLSVTAFLTLYVPFGAAICAAMYWVTRWSEPALQVGHMPTDPCTIAYLRGGPSEAIRVAALALLERGALEPAAKDNLSGCSRVQLPPTASPVEYVVHEHFSKGGDARSMFRDKQLQALVRGHTAPTLETARLIPDEPLRDGRRRHLYWALFVLIGPAVPALPAALSGEAAHLQLLVIIVYVYCRIAYGVSQRRRTCAGDVALRRLEQTFESTCNRMQDSARPRPEDVAIVAAVFGLAAIPNVAHAQIAALWPKNDGGGGWGGGGSDNVGSQDECDDGGFDCGGD